MNLYEIAYDSLGIYPKSTFTKGEETKRTEWQEGWNACYSKILDNVIILEKWLSSLEDNHRNLLEKVEDDLYVKFEDGQIECFINCSDFFHWAFADCVELDDFDLLEKSLEDGGVDGALLYCARKRQMRPQGAYYKFLKPENHHWFDECGEEREINFTNPE